MLRTMTDIRKASAGSKNSHEWFTLKSLGYWETETVHDAVFPFDGGAFFVTSDVINENDGRQWSVRMASDEGEISTIGRAGCFTSKVSAVEAAEWFARAQGLFSCPECGLVSLIDNGRDIGHSHGSNSSRDLALIWFHKQSPLPETLV